MRNVIIPTILSLLISDIKNKENDSDGNQLLLEFSAFLRELFF